MNSNSKDWHSISLEEVLANLSLNTEKGLSSDEVAERLKENGPNKFEGKKKGEFLSRFFSQFKSPLVYILLLAGIATVFLERVVDAVVIFIALAINVIVGLIQEGRASRAFEKLNKSQEKHAKVIRNGKLQTVLSEDLTLGDLVVIEAGDYVPADIRLVESNGLQVNESALTGESVPVNKQTDAVSKDSQVSERNNMAWMGTLVAEGIGKGVVVAIGGQTQIGEIAESLIGKDEIKTPLQKNVQSIARFLLFAVALIIVIIFGLGVWRGEPIAEMALVAIAVAVSALPEGLPAAVTVVLAIGMEYVLKKGGLVRSLLAAETLGSTTVILTDKTGTLTEARMSLSSLIMAEGVFEIKEGLPKGDFKELVEMAVLTSDAFVEDVDGEEVIKGRPLEVAVLAGARSLEIDAQDEWDRFPRVDYIPFKSETRFELSLNEMKKGYRRLHASGSPEELLAISSKILLNGKEVALTESLKSKMIALQEERSARGERMIAVAYKDVSWSKIPKEDGKLTTPETADFVFMGFLSFIDPLRPEVRASIQEVKEAGARIFMVTGDHPETALYIAKEAGLAHINSKVLTGVDIEKMSDKEILESLEKTSVFARVVPSQKLRLVNIIRGQGEVVAMTGDGVNDAPALRNADIGVAVESGTEVAKESSDMVLLGNSFTIIVDAIREGRRIIDNLKKVVAHLLSTSFGEIFVISIAIIIGLPLPILPAQILWMNIIQEGLLNFAYAFEPAEKGVMKRSPRSLQSKNILTHKVKQLIFASGAVTGILMIAMFLLMTFVWNLPLKEIRTLVFVGLSLDAIVFAISLKNMHIPLWKINPFSNKYLIGSLLVSILLLVATLTVPFLKNLLSIADLSQAGLAIIAVIAVFDVLIIEAAKYLIMYRKGLNPTKA